MLPSEKDWQEMLRGIFQGEVKFDLPMKEHTSLELGGPADVFITPDDPLSLRNLITLLKKKNIPFLPLGRGTNLLVRDSGIDGVVIYMKAFGRIEVLREGNRYAELFVEAGVPWQKLVNFCAEKGYAGIEGLTGIPGSAGGAIYGNAGSFGYETKDVVVSVAIMDADGRLDRFKAEGLGFEYRHCDILPGDIILSANLKLTRDDKEAVAGRTANFFQEKRQKQPISERSAGCVFRNPAGASAGRLIDEAGCKGMRVGGIEVSAIHANFFINNGKGTASDYINLMNEVSSLVNRKFGVLLQPEIKIVGRG
ncbi:MAG: UDP-N-acetylmuramate dehydrogenase [Nitrospirae bacterium]|nr:UDP-N-acetylmuramate dehydrogenase [Nitrospirota bacterium]